MLSEITVPDSITYIGSEAFYKAISIKKVNLPDNTLNTIHGYSFRGSGIEELVIPEGVKYMDGSFIECSNLKSVSFPSSLVYIFPESILAIIAVVSLCLKINKLIRWKKQNIEIGKNKIYKIIGISIGLVLRIILLVLVMIWPYLFNYNYYLIRIWMSNAIFVWEGLVIINCILAVVIKIRRIAATSIYIAE